MQLDIHHYSAGFFDSNAEGELVFNQNGEIHSLLPVEQEISQGILPDGSIVRVRSFLPLNSRIYQLLTEGPLGIHWQQPGHPFILQSTVYLNGRTTNKLHISNASANIDHQSVDWQGVHVIVHQQGNHHFKIHYGISRFILSNPAIHQNINLNNLHGQYQLQPVANGQLQLRSSLQLGSSQLGPVTIHRITDAGTMTFPEALYNAIQNQAKQESQDFNPAQMNHVYSQQQHLWMHSPLHFQIKHLVIDAGNGARFSAHLNFATQGLATFHFQPGESPANLAWPAGNDLQVALHISKPMLLQLLVFTETHYGQQMATAEQQLLAKQVVDQLAHNPLFADQNGHFILHIQAQNQQIQINHQTLSKADADILSAVVLFDSIQQNA